MTVVYKLTFLRARCVALAVMLSVLAGFPYLAPGEELNQLIQQLKSPDPFARFAAAGKVAELGPSAADAAEALLEALKCEQIEALFESPQIAASRQRFADALIRIGERVTPQLQKALENENGLVRVWSAWALFQLDRDRYRAQVLPVLIDALRQDSETAGDAALVLEQMGQNAVAAISALIEQLKHREPLVRSNAALALAAIVQGDHARHRLAEALQHASPLVRVGAAFALQKVRPEAASDVQSVLGAALQDSSSAVRRQAVWAIGQLGAAAQPLAKKLINALPNLEPNIVEYFLGPDALARYSSDPSLVLAATGPDSKAALLEALESEQSRVRVMAAVALLRLDPNQAARVAPVLKAARNDSNDMIRILANMSSPPEVRAGQQDIKGLIGELLATDDDFGPPSPAAAQLIQRGAEAVGPLMEILQRGDGLAARRVGSILAAIGAAALPALREAVQSDNEQLRVFAVGTLAGMGPPAVPLLVTALNDNLYPVRRAARHALRSIGTPEALEALQKTSGKP